MYGGGPNTAWRAALGPATAGEVPAGSGRSGREFLGENGWESIAVTVAIGPNRVGKAGKGPVVLLCFAEPDQGRPAVAVKQVRVSDLSGRQASEEQFAKLIVHEHPQYQGPITLDVLPEEIGELPESDQYVSIEVIQPGERSGQRALLSVDSFNKLASSGDMPTILLNAVATQQPQRPAQARRRGRGRRDGQASGRGKVEWGLPHRGRISPEEAAYVREHLDEVQRLRTERGVPLLDPADPKTKQRYGL
jgi:hypothetical protein